MGPDGKGEGAPNGTYVGRRRTSDRIGHTLAHGVFDPTFKSLREREALTNTS